MKNNTNKNHPCDAKVASEPLVTASSRAAGSTRHKMLVAIVVVTAAWLSYQSVNEAFVLHRLLDQTQEAMSEGMPSKNPTNTGSNISETKPRVTGL